MNTTTPERQTVRAIDGIPQHDQCLEGDVMRVPFAGGEWICEVFQEPGSSYVELNGVQVNGRWYFPIELLSDTACDALHEAIYREIEKDARIARENAEDEAAEDAVLPVGEVLEFA